MTIGERAEALVLDWVQQECGDHRPTLRALAALVSRIECGWWPVEAIAGSAPSKTRAEVETVKRRGSHGPKSTEKSPCAETGCTERVVCKGLCQKHYDKRRNAALAAKKKAAPPVVRFDGAPSEGEGERRTECSHARTCLMHAHRQKWKAFNCSSCSLAKGAAA